VPIVIQFHSHQENLLLQYHLYHREYTVKCYVHQKGNQAEELGVYMQSAVTAISSLLLHLLLPSATRDMP
jgi:hypothetical protein